MQGIPETLSIKSESQCKDLVVHLVVELQNAVSTALIKDGPSTASEQILPVSFAIYGNQVRRLQAWPQRMQGPAKLLHALELDPVKP